MPVRHLISLAQLGPETLAHLVGRSVEYAAGHLNGHKPLLDKTVGIYFRKSSTRTRTSFTVGALKLGASTVAFGPEDLQIVTGEPLEDPGRVLSCYLDALVTRTNEAEKEMNALAAQTDMAVINAMSAEEHPTQAIADLSTIKEGLGRLEGIHLLYLGEGNNTAMALALALGQTPGTTLTLVTPEGSGLSPEAMEMADLLARKHGSAVTQHHRMDLIPTSVDVVYTTRWKTMGVPKTDPNWRSKYEPYCVTPEIMARVSKPNETIFMHDLPAVRGDEVDAAVLDGPQSRAWRQAHHKMFGAMAVLEWCLEDS